MAGPCVIIWCTSRCGTTSAPTRGLDGSLYGEAGLRSDHEAQHTAWIRRWRSERGL